MICPRWTPRATATLANLGGSSRQASSRRILFPCSDSKSKRGFSTSRGNDEDGFAGRLSRETTPQSFNASQQSSSGSTTGQAPYPLPRRRARPATANSTSVDRRPRHKQNTNGHRQSWIGRGGGGVESESPHAPRRIWPHLQRREREGRQGQEEDRRTGNAALAIPKRMFSPRQNAQNPKGTKESPRIMLIVDGLSPNLSATDFYRITPSDLSNWQSVITKVQQQRNPDTFEPLGRYLVTFSNGVAAASYRDRLVRLHKLNSFKLRSASGLWESNVPLSLKVSLASPSSGSPSSSSSSTAVATETSDAVISDVPNTESVVDLVNTFTLAPGSQTVLPVQRNRVVLARPWEKRLAGLVENLGYGERPSVLMVEVYPPTLTAEELHQFIRRDDQNRGLRWQLSVPQHLKMHSPELGLAKAKAKVADDDGEMKEGDEAAPNKQQQGPSLTLNDRETWEKLKGRFVLACADEAEARRFQQSWNHRALTTLRPRPARYIVHASIINW